MARGLFCLINRTYKGYNKSNIIIPAVCHLDCRAERFHIDKEMSVRDKKKQGGPNGYSKERAGI